jgi:hypothetical protein
MDGQVHHHHRSLRIGFDGSRLWGLNLFSVPGETVSDAGPSCAAARADPTVVARSAGTPLSLPVRRA